MKLFYTIFKKSSFFKRNLRVSYFFLFSFLLVFISFRFHFFSFSFLFVFVFFLLSFLQKFLHCLCFYHKCYGFDRALFILSRFLAYTLSCSYQDFPGAGMSALKVAGVPTEVRNTDPAHNHTVFNKRY